ncbi:hypothetical protein AVEN_251200-1 [Araneus ventricosus]|uniref:Uncharacterized protein n=1 Tax=Araneus ventricosus TaxID=182803 RepID=A0A4Y2MUH3_ARAVE|nr:hypothetical protein AVEN_251200-1 [Araneus ventricosus]
MGQKEDAQKTFHYATKLDTKLATLCKQWWLFVQALEALALCLQTLGSQILFDVHRTAKLTANLRHQDMGRGLKTFFRQWPQHVKIRHLSIRLLRWQ